MKTLAAVALASLLTAAPAIAADSGDPCSAFSWPLAQEKSLLANAAQTPAQNGTQFAQVLPLAFRLSLLKDSDAKFAVAPQKPPRPDGFGASVTLAGPPSDGDYLVTLSSEGWIDVIQKNAPGATIDIAVTKAK